jgi:predicted RNase H-like HicB family nuclease
MLDDHFARAVLTAIFFEENGPVTGFVEELLGVSAHGRNLKEARSRLTAAARKFLEDNREGVRQRMESYGTVTRERLFVDITRE